MNGELFSINLDALEDVELLESFSGNIMSKADLIEDLYNKYKTPDKSIQDDTPSGPTL